MATSTNIRKQVYTRFPIMRGTRPTVSTRKDGGRTFTFKARVPIPGGHTLTQVVRVTVDREGRVVSMTASK
jgi:hypothetical protein